MVMDEWLDRATSNYQGHHYNPVLLDFCNVFKLKDAWHTENPGSQIFTWFKPDGSIKSRIDFWLVSENRPRMESNSTISVAPLTDYCIVKLIINLLSSNSIVNCTLPLIHAETLMLSSSTLRTG